MLVFSAVMGYSSRGVSSSVVVSMGLLDLLMAILMAVCFFRVISLFNSFLPLSFETSVLSVQFLSDFS